MFLRNTISALFTFAVCVNAITTTPRSTTFYSNTTSPTSTSTSTSTSSSASITGRCCFVVQDTVSEDWWQMMTYSTGPAVINLTSITTYITPMKNGTVTNVVTNVYLTNGTFTWTGTGGVNPITDYINGAPGPSQVMQELSGTAVVTGGVTITSPAAFYVYNSVKVITVAAVTDKSGNKACGTSSAWPQATDANDTVTALSFDGINSNAEAYFGGYGIGGASLVPTVTSTGTYRFFNDFRIFETTTAESIGYATFYTNTGGSTIEIQPAPTGGVEIALTAPFIYQPDRGKDGGLPTKGCGTQGPGKENYGYVPQAVIDYLAGIPAYSSQFPGLASCLPGGPSILPDICRSPSYTYQSAIGGDLTSSTVITVTPQGVAQVTPTQVHGNVEGGSTNFGPFQGVAQTQSQNNPPPASVPPNPPASIKPLQDVQTTAAQGQPAPSNQAPPNQGVQSTPPAQPQPQPSLGAIINSMIGGAPNTPTSQGIIIPGPTTIPVVNAPAGLQGSSSNIDGTPVIIVPQATTLPPVQGPPQAQETIIPGPTTIPIANAPQGLQGVTSNIDGTPVIIVPQATTLAQVQGPPQAQDTIILGPTAIPIANAPAGLQGSTTVIGGSSFIVVPAATTLPAGIAQGFIIPGPTTVPAAGAPLGLTGSTTIIAGTPFIIVPSATTLPAVPQGFVIPGPTTIPVAGAPQGLTGSTTVIGGTPFIIVPSATTLPIQGGVTGIPGASTTLIGGTPFVIIAGPTSIPLSEAPTGLSGSTTTINGTPFLIVPSATTLALSQGNEGVSTTEFGGISFLIYPSPTTIPLSGAPAGLHGSTTTINGTPFLILSAPTTIPMTSSSPPTTSPTSTYPGRITVISGSQYEVFSGPTTVPVDPNVSLNGKTTVISGTTEVILTAATTVPVKGTGSANGGANKSSAIAERKVSWMLFTSSVAAAFVLVFW